MKKVLYIIVGLIAIILIVAAILPKDYMVERTITIDRSNDIVFEYVKYLKNQDNYSAWAKMDPDSKKTYTGTDGEVGFISAWKSEVKDVGAGEQEILNIVEGKQIDYEIRFKEPFESQGYSTMKTENVTDNQSEVLWSFNGKMPWPTNLMYHFGGMEEMLGGSLQEGLEGLKVIVESIPVLVEPSEAELEAVEEGAEDAMEIDEIE